MTIEVRTFKEGRVRVEYFDHGKDACSYMWKFWPCVLHVAELHGPAAVDSVMCQRCNSTSRWGVEAFVCPRCGPLRHSYEVRGDTVDDLGFHPILPETLTGSYVDNTSPLAGFREPARVWMEGTNGNKN